MFDAMTRLAVVMLLAALAACSANGGLDGPDDNPGGEPPPGEEPPIDPDISDWEPINRGAASGSYSSNCSPLSSCSIADEANSFDGDPETATLVTFTGALGDTVTAVFDTGPVAVADDAVAAVELASATALSLGFGASVDTLFEGEVVEAGCGSLSELDTAGGTDVLLLGCRHSEVYDQIRLSLSVTAPSNGLAVSVIDVVTAAVPPPPAE